MPVPRQIASKANCKSSIKSRTSSTPTESLTSDVERVCAMPLHAQRQCLQAAQRQKTIERPRDCADRVLQECNLIAQFLVFTDNDNTANHIGMSAQIFRGRVNHEIETKFDRPLNPRAGKRVVRNRNDVLFARNFRNRFQVDNLEQRITWRLNPDHPRVRFDFALKYVRVRKIDKGKIEISRPAAHALKKAKCTAIEIVAHDNM